MLVRGIGIRDIAEIENISIKKVLSAPVNSRHLIQPKQPYYDRLEVDELFRICIRQHTFYITTNVETPISRVMAYINKKVAFIT
jgi:hypothetical protein